MTSLLHIDSSVRQAGSLSRQLGGEFVAKWQAAQPSATVVTRDLAVTPLPHLSEQVIGAFFTPPELRDDGQSAALATSDTLVDELLAADVIVIGAPMYNFSVTSGLKAWIDHIARVGRTFRYDSNGPEGLVLNKKVYVFTASGSVYSQGPYAGYDHLTTYLRAVLGFIGMTDITFIATEGVARGEDAISAAVAKSRGEIEALAA